MVQETAAVEKPKEEAPKAPEPPKEALGTGIKGNGPGMSGLGGSGDGGGTFGGRTGGGGSKYGYFAGQVQKKVATALRSNSRTKKATLKIQVRIWSDATGRITRAKLDASTGDPSLDDAIQNQVLTGLQLDEPPPAGMPMPIVMRLTARRP
jgi:outer membrane biosynthesis protein TonB